MGRRHQKAQKRTNHGDSVCVGGGSICLNGIDLGR